MSKKIKLFQNVSAIILISLFTSACSHNGVKADAKSVANKDTYPDTYEGINRKIYGFNATVDGLILKPAAMAYKAAAPAFVEKGIGNFFSNLDDVGNAINNGLQFKFADALSDTERFVFNSTLGFAGLVDVASSAGLKKHDEDFGQTLAKWGVGSGPYVMLPFLGPSSVRDGFGKLTIDRATDPANYTDANIEMFITETLKKRSDLFSREAVLDDLSDDKYNAVKGIWIENRKFLVNDGKVDKNSESDLIDELESLDDI